MFTCIGLNVAIVSFYISYISWNLLIRDLKLLSSSTTNTLLMKYICSNLELMTIREAAAFLFVIKFT